MMRINSCVPIPMMITDSEKRSTHFRLPTLKMCRKECLSAENVDFGKKIFLERHSRSYIINFEIEGILVRKASWT